MPIRPGFSAFLAAFALLVTIGTSTAAASSHGHRSPGIGLADAVRLAGPAQPAAAVQHRRSASRKPAALARPAAPAATASSQPAKPPAPAGLLFDGEHVSDFSLLQAAPGAITEVPKPAGTGSAIEMNVNNHDVAPITPTENPRAQALSPSIIEPGDEFWLSTSFYIPPEYPTVNGWMSLVSIYGPPFAGSSPWQIEVVGNELQWMRNGTYHWDVPWQTPLVKGSWITVLLHERFATDGWVEMWVNGQQVSFFNRETKLNMQTMDSSNGAGANSAKIMQYRKVGMFEQAAVYFGPLKIGTTRESVGGG
jgi:hypothetical protein